ncbi:General substrate transporter [Kalmanozyma brasiliensis GHG001]|uniref:General substrate transporter n=1 Tax=Kalmanozyma brasiliensis (strain GHG001) TaxID=1365824 RepID=UPI002867D394|nr:General substrate transporter [Kalmanozyma brasiliensis GHG001]EST06242.2 General substrate transporter [Kalmanozyma brasiliensis GHG001]
MTDPASAAVDSAAASNGVSNGKKTNQLADLDRFNPLRSSTDNEDDDDDHDDLRPLDDSELSSASYLARLAGVACLLGLQFGWDTGIASGMLVAIHADLGHDLSEGEQELIVSATTVGAILGSIVAGRMADWLGRKKVMVGAGILFLLGAMEQAASQVVRELVLGRVLVGLGVGMASMVVPTYLAEIAPTKVRGRIIGINSLLITGGQVIAYLIDAAFYNLPHGWRWMVLAGGVPAIFQLIGMIYLDESPRWLVARGRIIRARHVLQRIYPRASVRAIDNEIERIARSMEGTTQRDAVDPDSAHAADRQAEQQPRSGSNDLQATLGRVAAAPAQLTSSARQTTTEVKSKLSLLLHHHRRPLIICCTLQAAQQLVGFNSLMYFSGRLLLMAGFVLNPNAAAVGIAIANFVGTLIAMRYIDIWGRRKLLLYTTAAMTFFLSLVAIGFSQIDLGPITGGPPTTTTTTTTTTPTSAWPYLTLAFMILFTLSYALGLGIVPWLIQSEIFSGQVRGVGAGLATATNWSTNLLISSTFLHMVKWIRPQGCFGLFSVVAALSWAFTYWQLPEMAGVSLSDVGGEAEREVYRAVPAEEESD